MSASPVAYSHQLELPWRYWCVLDADNACRPVYIAWTCAVAVLCRRVDLHDDVPGDYFATGAVSGGFKVYLGADDYRRARHVEEEVRGLWPGILETVRLRLTLRLYVELRAVVTAPAMDYLCRRSPAPALRAALRSLAVVRGWA